MKQKIASTTNSAQLAKNAPSRPPLNPAIFREKSSEHDTLEDVYRVAESGYRLAKKIADLVNIEKKCYFYGQTDAVPAPVVNSLTRNYSGMTPVILNAMEQGDSDFQRNGDSIKVQHLDFFLTFKQGSNAIIPNYRLIIFWDETNSSVLTTDIIEAAFVATSLTMSMTKDWDEKASTKILFDHHWKPTQLQYADTGGVMYNGCYEHHRVSIPVNKHTQFEADSTTVVTGALKFILITDISTTFSFDWSSRVIFTDD